MRPAAEGIIWLSLKRTVVLREASGRFRGIWVQDKYIRPVSGQQDDRRETSNIMIARGQPQNIMRRRKRGDKNDTVDRV